MALEQFSGNGFLLSEKEGRSPVSYVLALIEADGLKTIEGTITGDYDVLRAAWLSGARITLLLGDGRSVSGIIHTVEWEKARFVSSGVLPT
jgi:hypothetical protein